MVQYHQWYCNEGRKPKMKRIVTLALTMLLLLSCIPAQAEVSRDPHLDAAFTCLEENNPFLKRYNELTGADIVPMIETGVPYFFGGQNPDYLLKVKKLAENSSYGKAGDTYIYGFDCVGYTRWIQAQCGEKASPTLTAMINQWYNYADYRLDHLKEMTDFAQIAAELQVGDFFVGKHKGRHILMYIGTLADYGYTADDAPELADYLHYPLLINCGSNPNYIERTAQYIEEKGLNAKPNKGGVMVSIIGPTADETPHLRTDGNGDFYYFDLNGYQLSIYDIHSCTSYVWWRTIEADKNQ